MSRRKHPLSTNSRFSRNQTLPGCCFSKDLRECSYQPDAPARNFGSLASPALFEVAQRRIRPAFRRSGLQARPERRRKRRAWRPVLQLSATSNLTLRVVRNRELKPTATCCRHCCRKLTQWSTSHSGTLIGETDHFPARRPFRSLITNEAHDDR